jgi:hypothetical protein
MSHSAIEVESLTRASAPPCAVLPDPEICVDPRKAIRDNAAQQAAELGLEIEFVRRIKAFREEDRVHDIRGP